MTRVLLTACVCALLIPGVARAQFLWDENFESGDLENWTITTAGGEISREGDLMRMDAQGDPIRVEANHAVPYPAQGETNTLYFSGLMSPGRNAYMFLGAGPFEVVYFDIQEPDGYFRARFDGAYFGGPAPGNGTDTYLPGGGDDVADFRYVFTGMADDQVQVRWEWKMSVEEEYVAVEGGVQTVAKADFPDLKAHMQAAWRGEGDSSVWFANRVAYESGSAPVCDPGDADGDGDVDDDDLSLLLANWGSETASCAQGEFSGAVPVNDDDLSLLLANWTGALASAVPEPATMALLVLVAPALLRARRKG